jgi:hypothetical protein
MSHGAVFLGRVFMWCLVPFFCGLDEHSTASAARPPHPGRGKPTDGWMSRAGGTAVPARSALTGDMLRALLAGRGSAAVWDKTRRRFGLGLFVRKGSLV